LGSVESAALVYLVAFELERFICAMTRDGASETSMVVAAAGFRLKIRG